jgi:hypothetical protein
MNTLLITSSCFFLIPGYFAWTCGLYAYSALSTVTTLASIQYWIHPVDGMRRNTDLIIAKVSFTVYFLSGCSVLRDVPLGLGIVGCITIGLFYALANRAWNQNRNIWSKYHMVFHLFVALEQCLVLYGVVDRERE